MEHATWVLRPRLLEALPTRGGYVVWLQAPYGYGKTVLLQQWTDRLRAHGWRVLWADAATGSLLEQLGRMLGLPGLPSWALLQCVLTESPTVLVLDDLTPDTLLSLRLPSENLLLGLASRGELRWPELPRARTAGRLVHLTADDLRFRLAEVQQLLADGARAYEIWERTGGWPIAVHVAALTGTLDLQSALAQGVRESLGQQEWEVLLLLSAVPALPEELAEGPLRRLQASGFVQRTAQGFRLHALFTEVLHACAWTEIQESVRRRAADLPLELRAEAYLRAALWRELEALLESPAALDLASTVPSSLVRWCRALPGMGGPWRRLGYGMALCLTGRLGEAFHRLERLAREADRLDPEVAIRAWGLIAYNAPEVDLELALRAVDEGYRLVPRVDPHSAARFLNWTCWPLWKARQLERFQAVLEEARSLLPADDPYVFHPIGYNLAFLRWQQQGDLDYYLAYNRRTAEAQERERSHNLPLTLLQTGRLLLLAGRREEALTCFRTAQAQPGRNFWAEALAAAWQACLERKCEPFERLVTLAETSENPELEDAVRGLWARTLRETGCVDEAAQVVRPARGFWSQLELALSLWHLGRGDEAVASLPSPPYDREERAYYHAARYRILRREEDLEALCGLTSLGSRILPALLSVSELPPHRPELADAYPIEAVLRAGWKEAVERRLDEVPPLVVEILGRFRLTRVGEELSLSPTARALLVLLVMGRELEEVAGQLWPDADADQARNNLHVQLHHLRRALQPWRVPTYLAGNALRNTRVDFWDLEAALQQEDAKSVLRLYREPLAPGVDLPAVDEVRYALQRRVVHCLYQAGRDAAPEEGIAYLERVLELDPTHEPALQALLRHLLSLGHRQAVLRFYRDFEERLREEVGVAPLPETRALVQDHLRPALLDRRRR